MKKYYLDINNNVLGLICVMISFLGILYVNLVTVSNPEQWIFLPVFLIGLFVASIKKRVTA